MCDVDQWFYVESDLSQYNKEKYTRPTINSREFLIYDSTNFLLAVLRGSL